MWNSLAVHGDEINFENWDVGSRAWKVVCLSVWRTPHGMRRRRRDMSIHGTWAASLNQQHIQMHIDSAVHQLSLYCLGGPSSPVLFVYKCRNHDTHQQTSHQPPAKGPPDGIGQKARNSFGGKKNKVEPAHTHGCKESGGPNISPSRQVDKSSKNLHAFLAFPSVLCLLFSLISPSTFALCRALLSPCWPFWT